jgi:hypothetical protein
MHPAPTEENVSTREGGEAADAQAIDYPKIIGVGVVSLLVFALGVWWAYRILTVQMPEIRGPGSVAGAKAIREPEIGIVDQVPFAEDRRLEEELAAQQRRLESWGWADRQRGLIYMPITVAIDRLLAGEEPRAVPQPPAAEPPRAVPPQAPTPQRDAPRRRGPTPAPGPGEEGRR